MAVYGTVIRYLLVVKCLSLSNIYFPQIYSSLISVEVERFNFARPDGAVKETF